MNIQNKYTILVYKEFDKYFDFIFKALQKNCISFEQLKIIIDGILFHKNRLDEVDEEKKIYIPRIFILQRKGGEESFHRAGQL